MRVEEEEMVETEKGGGWGLDGCLLVEVVVEV